MDLNDINIRDPFIIYESSTYYMYGTRAKKFGRKTGGFDVYTSSDLKNWSGPHECFNSEINELNDGENWAPEVHRYNGEYYMFATFRQKNGLRGVFILKSNNPEGPFLKHSVGAITPESWECLDGTLYVDKNGEPYIVFCHEHTQIKDGTICYMKLSGDLKTAVSEPFLIFSASSPKWVKFKLRFKHYVTDGPFMYRTSTGKLLMLWSTTINHKYAIAVAESDNGEIDGKFTQHEPLFTQDSGHSMIFEADGKLMITYHTPNKTNFERPVIRELIDNGNRIVIDSQTYIKKAGKIPAFLFQ